MISKIKLFDYIAYSYFDHIVFAVTPWKDTLNPLKTTLLKV